MLGSPARAGGGAAAGGAAAAASPAHLHRLDRLLELVTEHESSYREQASRRPALPLFPASACLRAAARRQPAARPPAPLQDIRLAELAARLAELELRTSPSSGEWAPVWALTRERNVAQELDLARAAVEALARQLSAQAKSHAGLQAELRSAQARAQQQAAAHEAAVALLQAEVAALRRAHDDGAEQTRAGLEQLRTSVGLQLERQRGEAEEQLQSWQREVSSTLSLVRQDLSAKAASSVRELEAWSKGELLAMAAKVKAVVAACANQQQQVNHQMEALQEQWESTSAAIEGCSTEGKRVKKAVVRLQSLAEDLQHASQQHAAAGEAGLLALRQEVQQLAAAQQSLCARLDLTASSLGGRAAEADQQLATLAESMRGVLAAARADAAASAAAPSSYLSTLLAPPAQALAAASGGGASQRQPWAAWDRELAEFDGLVGRLRTRLHGDGRAQGQAGSPAKPGARAGQLLQAWSPGTSTAGSSLRR
ncbi:hypothetical protein HT031_001662 [Scenedesmus sp. PABB004]|nr:hypothetical protein HT031_001662 [Scenedesmus sp. PABB004]